MTLLRGLVELSGAALLADTLLHKVSPIAMTAVVAAVRATSAAAAAARHYWWAAYPLALLRLRHLARAQLDGRYPYPFMDVSRLGWPQTLMNAGGIAMAFLLAGLLLVWFDGWRPLGSKRGTG